MPVPDVPRSMWERHPHFPTQTLLLGSHEGFRRMSSWVIKAVAELDPLDPDTIKKRTRWIARYRDDFDWWMTGMKGHERYEERTLYPYLTRRYDALFAHLQRDHRELDARKQAVQRAFGAVVPGSSGEVDAMTALSSALGEHRTLLLEHLHAEEDMVLPMLLELTPAEFRALTAEPLEDPLSRPR